MKLVQYGRKPSRTVLAREPSVRAFVVGHLDKNRIDLEIGCPPGSHAALVRCEMTADEVRELVRNLELALCGVPW